MTTYPFERGPYLSAALLCERVPREGDGVKSALRISDRAPKLTPRWNLHGISYVI